MTHYSVCVYAYIPSCVYAYMRKNTHFRSVYCGSALFFPMHEYMHELLRAANPVA